MAAETNGSDATDGVPRCDYCGDRAYARYMASRGTRWINVCSACEPDGAVNFRCYHDREHPAFPAELPTEVDGRNR